MNLRSGVRASTIAAVATVVACRAVPPLLGSNPAGAAATADGIFGGIAARFDGPVRDPKVRASRRVITRAVLTPSRVFDDTAAWTWSPSPLVRAVHIRGVIEPGRYRFIADGNVSLPARAGEGRHDTRLRRLGDDEFEWTMSGDYGIGGTTPAALAALPVAWIAAGERDDSAALRADVHAAFPRSTREWGRLFSVVSFASARDASGAWRQRRVIAVSSKRLSATHPKFGAWVREHISPMQIHLRVHDGSRTWFDFSLRNDTIVTLTRSVNGRLQPLEGGNAPLPDTATLEADFSTKVMVFRVGFRQLRGEFVTVRAPQERGWSMRWTREPEWNLPLFTERMIRTPLRRPFQGTGVQFRIVAQRDSAAPQTLLTRKIIAPVQESAIVRFIASLANAGVGDYVDGADTEANRWVSAAFAALRDDTRSILRGLETQTPSR